MDFIKRLLTPKTKQVLVGSMSVFEAGKSIVIGEGYKFYSITIQSHHTNDGIIFIGDVTVNPNNSFKLEPGDTISIDAHNNFVSPLHANSSKSGSVLQYLGLGEKI